MVDPVVMHVRRWLRYTLLAATAAAALAVLPGVLVGEVDIDDRSTWWWLLPAVAVAAFLWVLTIKIQGRSPTGTVVETKTKLAELVVQQYKDEDIFTSPHDPIPVVWHVAWSKLMDHPQRIGQEGSTSEDLPREIDKIADWFRGLRQRRLVITGGPGTGKTTLAIQLLRKLAETRTDDEPVPILLPAADWDVEKYPTLAEWVEERLRSDFEAKLLAKGAGTDAAHLLASQSHILPILDGLDELPERARATTVRALRRIPSGQQLIITSLSKEYRDLVGGRKPKVRGAVVIAPKALEPAVVADYLESCLTVTSPEWEEVLTVMRSDPSSALSKIASTALGVWLIRTVYIDKDADPTPLITTYRADRAALRAHLMDNLLDALLQTRAQSWRPAKVQEWVPRIAGLASESRNITWWTLVNQAARRTRKRWLLPVTWWSTLVSGLTYAIPVIGTASLIQGILFGPTQGLLFGVVFGLLAGYSSAGKVAKNPDFSRLSDLRQHLVQVWSRDLRLVLLAFYPLLLVVVFVWTEYGAQQGLLTALIMFLLNWFAMRMGEADRKPASTKADEDRLPAFTVAVTPRSTWRHNRSITGVHLAGGLLLGLAGGLISRVWLEIVNEGTTPELHQLIASAAALGAMVGLVQRPLRGVWLLTTTTLPFLGPGERLPLRLMKFLDDMHRSGVLRAVGPVYQFRHAELQAHLASLDPKVAKSG